MAEVVKIKFEVDKSQLDGAISSSKTLEQELKKAGVSVQNMDAAMEGVNDALQEAGVDAKTFAKALDQSDTSTKSLKTQLAEAKNEAVRMSQQFGAFSKEAQTAAQKAAKIKDEINDLNDTLDALNPEAKLNAFVKLGQGIQGGFQAATGALQVFGVENERITKLAQQFQGVLNLTQGINSVLQLKDVYGQLRLVLGLTTVATEGATAATAGFGAALSATGVGAIVVAIGALAFALYELEESFDQAAESSERLRKKWEDLDAARKTFETTFNKLLDERIDKLDFEIKKADARGASEKEILQLQIQRNEVMDQALGKAIAMGKATEEGEDALIKKRQKNGQELELLKIKLGQIVKLEQQIAGVEADKLKNKFDKLVPIATPKEAKKQTEEVMDVIATTVKERSSDIKPVEITKKLTDQEKRAIVSDYMNLASEFVGIMQEFNNIETQNRIATQDELLRTGKISEEKYQKEIAKIKRQQAEKDREFAIYQVIIKTAQSVMTTAGQVGFPAAIPLIAAITALGAAQVVAIQNAPLPKYKKGTLNLGGGNVDADGGQVIVAHRGEAIIPRERNMAYHPAIEAIYNGRISPKDINGFVEYKLSGRIPTSVNATISSRDLRSLRPNDTVNIKNSNVIAKQIAGEIGKLYDPRMR